jgi:hypothetical protein
VHVHRDAGRGRRDRETVVGRRRHDAGEGDAFGLAQRVEHGRAEETGTDQHALHRFRLGVVVMRKF